MAMMVFRTCGQVEGGLPNAVKAKMMFNIILDFGVGLVPFLGDIADGNDPKPPRQNEEAQSTNGFLCKNKPDTVIILTTH